jgi:hypothetical protein
MSHSFDKAKVVSALARFQSHLEAAIETRQSSWLSSDPWEGLLKNLEARPNAGDNIVQAADADGKPEWRVQSNYILVTVLGLAPERVNIAHARRLRIVMQKLGWTGSKNLRFRGRQAKGFYKAAEDA